MLARSATLPSLRSSTGFVSAARRASHSPAAVPARRPSPPYLPPSCILPAARSSLRDGVRETARPRPATSATPVTPAIASPAAVRLFRRAASQGVRAMASGDESAGLVATHGEDSCIFCKIRDGKIPSHKVLETEHALAILDAFPMARGHTLIIPKKHYAFMEDMPEEESTQLLKLLPAVSKAVRQATGAEGVNIFQNNGGPAGQLVFHVHVHVLPRTEADGLLAFGKSGPMIAAEEAKEVKEAIAAALPSNL
ncbi:hypothetical protein CLOM_g12796 [Closterium sp. NIES-68]|nr:hypothetical protein CLOM_g12796 [Closterium sp. NIES-68]GJP64602.1 hypothetical protein CLOP_g21577 [Closterium sp. NIES-67]